MPETPGNNIALVTGASRGIGRAIAAALARDGCDVIAVARRAESCAETCAAVEAAGRRAYALGADVSQETDVQAMVGEAASLWGPFSILVNNAGLARDGMFIRMSDDQWDEVIRVNLLGAIATTEAALPVLRQQGGVIVNIASIAGLYGNPGQANYAAAKAGVIGYTKALAPRLAREGIRMNCVIPGLIDTDMTASYSDRLKEEGRSRVALGRFGRAEEIAEVVAFLCSDKASYMVGSVVEAHGGLEA